MLYIGPHYSISKGVIQAIKDVEKMDGNAMQIFTGPPQSLNLGTIFSNSQNKLDSIKKAIKFPVFIHAKYLLNLAKPLIPKNKIFLIRLSQELDISVKMGMNGVVVHFGTASNGLDPKEASKNMVKSLVSVLKHADPNSNPILETSSGEGNLLGKTIPQINEIYSMIPKKYQKRITFCIDTCHIFVSGHPIHQPGGWNNYVDEFEKTIGKNKIKVIHLNDSKTKFNEKLDLHEDIGKGYLFDPRKGGSLEALREILIWASNNNVPCILETFVNFPRQIKLCRSLLKKVANKKTVNSKGGNINDSQKDLIEAFRQLMNFHKALGNIHQFQAYKNLVNKLSQMNRITINKVKNIEGVGEGILGKINEFQETGKIKVLEDMKKDKNLVALVELQKVYGVGPKIAQKFIQQNIYSVEELANSFKKGKIQLTDNQQIGLKYFDDLNTRIPLNDAKKMVKHIQKKIKGDVLLMGGYRLGKKDGKDIDLVIVGGEQEDILKNLKVVKVLEIGTNMITALIKFPNYKNVVHVDFRLAPKKLKSFFTLYFGSGENFSRKIRQIAKDKGYTLNEYGLRKNGKYVEQDFPTEESIFKFLETEYVKPTNRL